MDDEAKMRLDIAILQREMIDLKDAVTANTEQTADLVQAWRTATGFVSFVKYLAAFAVAVGVLLAVLKGGHPTPGITPK